MRDGSYLVDEGIFCEYKYKIFFVIPPHSFIPYYYEAQIAIPDNHSIYNETDKKKIRKLLNINNDLDTFFDFEGNFWIKIKFECQGNIANTYFDEVHKLTRKIINKLRELTFHEQ